MRKLYTTEAVFIAGQARRTGTLCAVCLSRLDIVQKLAIDHKGRVVHRKCDEQAHTTDSANKAQRREA